jgi:hypothetical protein
MPSLTWYVRRLRAMSAGEVAWRAGNRLRDLWLGSRLALGLEPGLTTHHHDGIPDPGFRVCDVGVGDWRSTDRDEERAWRERLVAEADQIARHRLTFFNLVDHHLGDPIDWNRDHESGRKARLRFAPLIDYRRFQTAGDAKVVWEPNRHHHLVVLGRAYRATGEIRYASAVVEQLESWLDQCPFGRGMNWRSPLELAIRLINWVWAVDLIRESGLVTGRFGSRLRESAHRHLWEITRKYSRGSSGNNHRIGEAAGVFVATSYFEGLDRDRRWWQESRRILSEEIIAQTYSDGGSREQATGYQVFALQLFLVAGVTARKLGQDFSPVYWSRLERMFEFLAALSEGGRPPMIGDCDDGYVLDLGRPRDVNGLFCIGSILFARPDFKALAGAYAEAARWLLTRTGRLDFDDVPSPPGPRLLASRALADSGYYLLQSGHIGQADRISVVFDCGALGFTAIAAHGHADALSFTLRAFGSDIFVDPGTFDYFTYPPWRAYFRSTRAHNTVVVDDRDQSTMLGPFLWSRPAPARCLTWEPAWQGGRVMGAHGGYRRLRDPVVHRRTLSLDAEERILTVCDDILARQSHKIAVSFHLAEDAVVWQEELNRYRIDVVAGTVWLEIDARLATQLLRGSEEPIAGWISRGYHRKVASTVLIARARFLGNVSLVHRVMMAPAIAEVMHEGAPQEPAMALDIVRRAT